MKAIRLQEQRPSRMVHRKGPPGISDLCIAAHLHPRDGASGEAG